jgi:hypothetical protein
VTRPTSAILTDLRTVARDLQAVETRRVALYDRRLGLYLEAREPDETGRPRLTNREIAEAANVQEVAVRAALRKHRLHTGADVAR